MKRYKVIKVILFTIIVLSAFQYFNILSLEKDAVKDERLHIHLNDEMTDIQKSKRLSEIDKLEHEISKGKKVVTVSFWTSIILAMGLVYKSSKRKK